MKRVSWKRRGREESPMVQLLGLDEEQERFRQRRSRRRIIVALSIGVVWVALGVVRIGSYVIVQPGTADAVDRRLDISGITTYAPKGDTFWATVGVIERPAPIQLFAAWLSGEQDAPKRTEVYGDQSRTESRRMSSAQMEGSKQVSEVIAARTLGIKVSGGGAELAAVDKEFPAFAVLKAGDVITAVNGVPICLQTDIVDALRGVEPGATVDVTLRRGSRTQTFPTPTKAVRGVTRPVFGVELTAATKDPCRVPFNVKINTDRIGGPSAGLAMTIALLDRLTPGELTGGQKVAVTGTIEGDGSVGEVGGVKQKTLTVKAAGAKLFLVPKSEVSLARPHAGNMRVVGVETLDEALAALRQFGGEPLPSPRG